MRKPEKIRLQDGTVRYQVRGPKPGGGTQYVRFRTKHEAEVYASEQHTARSSGATFNATIKFDALVEEFRTAHYVGLRASSIEDYDLNFARAGRYLGGKLLRTIKAKDIEAMRDAELVAIRERHRLITEAALARANARLQMAVAAKADTAVHEHKIEQLKKRAVAIQRTGSVSVNKVIGALRTLFTFAQSRGYVAQNVAEFSKKLKAVKKDRPMDQAVLTVAEFGRLLAATDADWRAAMGVLGYGGLRIGELLGLQWGDVEFDRGRILVRRQLCTATSELADTKTESGRRFVELPPAEVKELRLWKLRCPKGELDLCFPNGEGGLANYHNFGGRVFQPALRRAGLRRITIHELRHGAASMMIAAGCDIAALSRQLGHKNIAITLSIYGHWFQQRAETGIGARMAAFLAAEENGCVLVGPTENCVRGAA
jgi:integrase